MATVKATLSRVLDDVESTHERVTITRKGIPAAVLISPADLAALEDTLEMLRDPTVRGEIEQARAELAAGGGVAGEDLAAFIAAERAR